MLVYDKKNRTEIAYLNDYSAPKWVKLTTSSPVDIEYMTGDNSTGPMIYGGGQAWYMNSYAAGTWHPIPLRGLPLSGVSGDNAKGVVATINSGQIVAYCDSYRSAQWVIVAVV